MSALSTLELAQRLFIMGAGHIAGDARNAIVAALAFDAEWREYCASCDRQRAAMESFVAAHPAPRTGEPGRDRWETALKSVCDAARNWP